MYELVQRICVGTKIAGYLLASSTKVFYVTKKEINDYAKNGLIKGIHYDERAEGIRGNGVCLTRVPRKLVEASKVPLPTISLDMFYDLQNKEVYNNKIQGIIVHKLYKSTSELGSFEIDFSLLDTNASSSWILDAYTENSHICKANCNAHLQFKPPSRLNMDHYCTFYRVPKPKFLKFLNSINCYHYGVANSIHRSSTCILDYKSLSGSTCYQMCIELQEFDYTSLDKNIPELIRCEMIGMVFQLKMCFQDMNYNPKLSRYGMDIPLRNTW